LRAGGREGVAGVLNHLSGVVRRGMVLGARWAWVSRLRAGDFEDPRGVEE
jgi:hypothetical protein